MGWEFELKFAATEEDHRALRARYPHLLPIAMETTYYDTPGGDIRALRWTLRRRMENGVSVCALKTPGEGFGHGEWEVRCGSIEEGIGQLLAGGAPEKLGEFVSLGLSPVCGARFTRRAMDIVTADFTGELALDSGVLTGGGREIPLCEVELELKSGSREAMTAFMTDLADRFGLEPESQSKFRRAKALAEGE